MRANRVACAARERAAAGRGLARGAVVLCGVLWLGSVGSLLAADPPGAAASVEWGWWIYTSGTETYSDGNMVIGGPIGSAMLVYRDHAAGTTDWILVEGEALLLNTPGNPPERAVEAPGWATRSKRGATWGPQAPFDAPRLSNALRALYFRTRNGRPPIRHVPFLVGQGWDGNVGARLDQAIPLLESMDLLYKLEPNSTQGRVTAQDPAAGTRAAYHTVVKLTLDNSMVPEGPRPPSDGPNAPKMVTVAGIVSVPFTPDFRSDVDPPCGDGPRADAFFKVPTTAARRFVVTQDPNQSQRLLLAAYVRADANSPLAAVACAGGACCVVGERPRLQFDTAVGPEYFVVAQVLGDPPTPEAALNFQWTDLMAPAKGKKD